MAGLVNVAIQDGPRSEFAPAPRPLPRILYALALTPGHKLGSMEEQILVLAERFRAEHSLFLPLFICPAGEGNLEFYHARGVAAECLAFRPFRWSTLRRLLSVIDTHRIDAIHWNFTSPLGNRFLWCLTLLRPRLQHYFTDHISRPMSVRPPPRGPKHWLKKLLLRRYHKVFAISRFVLECLHAQQVWPGHARCCLHFINTDRFCPDRAAGDRLRRTLGDEGRFVVLVVAHLIDEKGVDLLIHAMAELPPETVLWVIGEGPARSALDALIAEKGLVRRVRMLGHQFDVGPYMQAADCVACPSRWAEAVGLVNLEGAACGLPVVASRVGGIPEHIEDGRTGLLFEPGNAQELGAHLGRLVREPAFARQLGEQGRAMVVQRFSTAVRLPEVLDLYRQ